MRLLLATTILLMVLSGCSSPSEDAAGEPGVVDAGGAFVPPGEATAQPRMRFAAAEFDQAMTYDDAFESGGCVPVTACDGYEVRFDVTAQVPADAPVELAATFKTDSGCINVYLEATDTAIQRYSNQDDRLSATLIRKASGTVTVSAYTCSVTLIDPDSAATPVSAEVRTVVRPDTLPAYMPVFVALAPGDRIAAMGADADDIEDFVIVPPGREAIHRLDDLTFEVTPAMPAGDYVIMVSGAQAMLHGPNVTMRPAPIQHFMGEDRDVGSGQPLSWTAATPGIPVYAALVLVTGESGGLDNTRVSFNGGYTMAILQDGVELAAYENPSCGAPCSMNGPGGEYRQSIGTDLFPEGLRPGDLAFEITNDMSQGMHAYEVIGYIEPAK